MSPPVARLTPDDLSRTEAARLSAELHHAALITVGDVTVEVSQHTREILAGIFGTLAEGGRVDVIPVPEMLTTQQAADLLRVSRPTLVKMLEDGVLPHERPGAHRRVSRVAIDDFIRSRGQRRAMALETFAETQDPDEPDDVVATR